MEDREEEEKWTPLILLFGLGVIIYVVYMLIKRRKDDRGVDADRGV